MSSSVRVSLIEHATSFFSTSGLNVDFTLDTSGRATSLKMGEIPGTRKQ